jgi:hypothetical protein
MTCREVLETAVLAAIIVGAIAGALLLGAHVIRLL